MISLGIDIGATGIKGALVDTDTGEFVSDRIRYKTPTNATPKQTIRIINKIISDLNWSGSIGIGCPLLIRNNVCFWASHLDSTWVGLNLIKFFNTQLNRKVFVANDADVAGLAEARFGCSELFSNNKTILFLTLGTGIGSALITQNNLLPNTELGFMPYRKGKLEDYISNSVRKSQNLSWKKYGKRLNKALHKLHFVLSPDHIILGGGISKKFDKFSPYIDKEIHVLPARLFNDAGIIGASVLCT